jgi:signal transduction histidine kinase/HAMP domain-containing protein
MRALISTKSIGSKIFAAFFALSVIVGALGAYSYGVLNTAGGIVVSTYDGPLMAINYARAASVDFTQMQNAMLRRGLASPGQRPAIDKEINDLVSTFFGDLEVAQERSNFPDELKAVRDIKALVQQWDVARLAGKASEPNPGLEALNAKILDRFDTLIELNTDHSFVERRKAVWSIGYYKYLSVAMTVLSLLLALGITAFLARRIVRPLSAAALVADRISAGELQTPIPRGGQDETGTLLSSMTVMQDNIREMMARETARALSAESRLVHALESSRVGVMLVNADGHILVANDQVRAFFPKLASHLTAGGDFAAAAGAIQSELADGVTFPSLAELAHRSGAPGEDAERQLKDGRWLHVTGSRTSAGDYFIFLSDFTSIKEREEAFKRMMHAAEAASAAKSRFVANMSHELRTPLNAVIGFSEIISGQLFGQIGNPKYVDYAADILRSGRHLLDVINSVLDMSRSEAGKLELNGETVDLRDILIDCAGMVRDACSAANLCLKVDDFDEALPIWGEKAKLRQIFLNLLSNAIKFTNAGGTVSIAARADGDFITVDIADTGIGMSDADIEVAFTPFAQVDARLARRYEGMGLGLPLTKAFADLHKAEFVLDSARGRGTTARLRFLRVAEAAASPTASVKELRAS